MHPIATLDMANGKKIVLKLLPEAAPNTVNSFIYAALGGYMDGHAIERIVPGNWVDISYTAFGKKECQYLIPNEFTLHPELTPLPSRPGMVAMGGYGEEGGYRAKRGSRAANFSFLLGSARSTLGSIRSLQKS